MICYSQRDTRWANYPYPYNNGGQTLKRSGCGVCSAATVVSSLSNTIVEPPEMADYSLANGFRTGEGTAHGLFTAVAKKYGLTCRRGSLKENGIPCVQDGYLAIVTANGGRKQLFTTGGHVFVLVGYDKKSHKLKFFDPDTYNGKYTYNEARKRYTTVKYETVNGVKTPFVYVEEGEAIAEIASCYCMTGPKKATTPSAPKPEPPRPPFADVPVSDYAWKHISALKDAGVINGDDEGNFRPNDTISRRDVAIMIGNCLYAAGVIDLAKYRI